MVNAAEQYRRTLKKKLRCCRSAKERLLLGFDQTLAAYLAEHIEPTIKDLTLAFGPPEEMADILMEEVTHQEQAQYRRDFLFVRILACILIAILTMSTFYIWFYKDNGLTYDDSIYEATNDWDDSYTPITEAP